MTALPNIHILDVGHGNSAIVVSDQVCVVDSPRRPQLRDKLRELSINKVDVAFVSHSDVDHLYGIANLLADDEFVVEHVYVNPDASKNTEAWLDFRATVAAARRERGVKVSTGVNTSVPGRIQLGRDVSVSVVSPAPENALGGPGGRDLDGARIDANTASIVLRVTHGERGRVFLAGDMTATTLKWIKDETLCAHSDILVFPHHGGLPGTSAAGPFTTSLLELVRPETVIFSNGRGIHKTPREEIVAEVLAGKGCVVACTQLSENCCTTIGDFASDHIQEVGLGKLKGHACAGTLTFDLSDHSLDRTALEPHGAFVRAHVSGALCSPPGNGN